MKSLKKRLQVWVCGSAAAIMVAAAVVLFTLARTYQINQLDRRVQEKARLIVSSIELDGESIELEFEELDLTDFQSPQAGWYLQVWIDQAPVYRSDSFDERQWQPPPAAGSSPPIDWVDLPDSTRGRGYLMTFDLENHEQDDAFTISVFIARDASEVLTALAYLAGGLTGVTAAAVLLMVIILTVVVNRSMGPVEKLAAAINQIDADDLDDNVESTDLPRELEPIVVQFNGLLTRLQSAFERERGFCTDVAHELRTPLAGLRTTMEVTMGRQRQPDEYAQAFGQCQQIVVQTQGLIDCLLQIAKLENGQMAPKPEPIDLNAQIQGTWQDVADKSTAAKTYQLQWKLSTDQPVETDPKILGMVLRNLFDNAIEYVDADGLIEVESTADGAKIVISNSGSQVGSEDVNKIFDRFWRGSASRTDTGCHFGLGLSLAQRALQNLGGSLSVEAELNGTFCATCVLGIGGKQ